MKKLFSIVALLACSSTIAHAWNNGLGKTPPMGWTSKYAYGITQTEDLIKGVGQYIKTVGLDKAGYLYVTLGDGWQSAQRAANQSLLADEQRFPSGIAALAANLAASGLKLGISQSAGIKSCKHQLPGSNGLENRDASDWASWGISYLKYDTCFNDGSTNTSFQAMQTALNQKKIFYGISSYDQENGVSGSLSLGNSYRTSSMSMEGSFVWIRQSFYRALTYAKQTGPGQWSDLGPLQIGVNTALTVWEESTHFALWAFAKSPLFVGVDFNQAAPEVMQIVTAPMIIALNQDSLGAMPSCIMNCQSSKGVEVFKIQAADNGTYTGVLAVNWDAQNTASTILDLVLIGAAPAAYYECLVVDMWFPTISSTVKNGVYNINKIAPHGNVALKISCKPPSSKQGIEEVFLQ